MKKEPSNKRLEMFISKGWRPSIHGEFLDLYNQRSRGVVSGTIKARIDDSNSFVVVKPISGTIQVGISSRNMHFVVHKYDEAKGHEDGNTEKD